MLTQLVSVIILIIIKINSVNAIFINLSAYTHYLKMSQNKGERGKTCIFNNTRELSLTTI